MATQSAWPWWVRAQGHTSAARRLAGISYKGIPLIMTRPPDAPAIDAANIVPSYNWGNICYAGGFLKRSWHACRFRLLLQKCRREEEALELGAVAGSQAACFMWLPALVGQFKCLVLLVQQDFCHCRIHFTLRHVYQAGAS